MYLAFRPRPRTHMPTVDEALAIMRVGSLFSRYEEVLHCVVLLLLVSQSVMSWKKPSGFEQVYVAMDPDCLVLAVRSADRTKFLGAVAVEDMTDVRTVPYTDESEVGGCLSLCVCGCLSVCVCVCVCVPGRCCD